MKAKKTNRVIYTGEGFGKTFNLALNLLKFWNVEYNNDISILNGRKLIDRQDKHTSKIKEAYFSMGTAMISHEDGFWQCLDHAIEQFDVVKNES